MVDTQFSFGTELDESGAVSGGIAAFISRDKLVFADGLSRGTVLSVVDILPDKMRIEAQVLSTTTLSHTQYDSWTWQTHWQNHLVPLSDERFALYSSQDDLQLFQIDQAGVLGQVERFQTPPEDLVDVVATADGHIWACGNQIKHLQVSAANVVLSFPSVSYADGSPTHCSRLAVAPDGDTIYASTKEGLVRWSASAVKPELQLIVPGGVRGFALTGNARYVSVQRAANFGAMGNVETYRTADGALVSTLTATADARPFGAELVGAQLVTIWDETSKAGDLQSQSLLWSPIAGSAESHRLLLRQRGDRVEPPTTGNQRLVANGQRLLTQPWRRLFQMSDDDASLSELTGAGQGTFESLVGEGSRLFALGPYSTQALSISSTKIGFADAPARFDALSPISLQLVVPGPSGRTSGFEPRQRPLKQTVEVESLRLMQLQSTGLEPLGELRLAGGPATLLQRGDFLYQLSRVDVQGFRLRVYQLSSAFASVATPAQPMLDMSFSIDAPPELVTRGEVAFDVDPITKELVLVESRNLLGATLPGPRSFLWLSFAKGTPKVLARQQRPEGYFTIALRDHRLMLVDNFRATVCSVEGGSIKDLSSVALPDVHPLDVLAFDGPDRLYASSFGNQSGYRDEMIVLGWDGPKLLSRFAMPAQAISVARAGQRLAIATKGSVHLAEPTCGEVDPPAGADWPFPNDGEPPPEHHCASLSTGCQDWSSPAVVGDVDHSGCVDAADAKIVLDCLGQTVDRCTQSVLADLNGDGVVNDYQTVIKNFGKGCTVTP